jgi:energy-coupling factor transport system ATP-binding protein
LEPLIRLSGVSFRYPGGPLILDTIDYKLFAGQSVLINGANGSGKSTLTYLFNGLIPHFFDGTLSGDVYVKGAPTRERTVAELSAAVGLVLQNTDAQLFNSTVEDEIAFGLESMGLPPAEIRHRIAIVAEQLHLEDLLTHTPQMLSDGQKRLVAIASLVCMQPETLVLDEPFANLDWQAMARVDAGLQAVQTTGTTLITIEHRLDNRLALPDRMLLLDQGQIRFDGSPSLALKSKAASRLVPAYPSPPAKTTSPGQVLLNLEGLSCQVGGRQLLNDISFRLHRGENVALIGINGAGKTTLLRCCQGLLRPTAGRIHYKGRPLAEYPPAQRATRIGLSFQNPNHQFFKTRVRDELSAGLIACKYNDRQWLEEVIDLFDLRSLLDRTPFQLSEGEKKRVSLAAVVALRPRLLLLDEPTVGQDVAAREALSHLLQRLQAEGFSMLIATHDLAFARAVAPRWLVLDQGTLIGDGPPDQLHDDDTPAARPRQPRGPLP